MTENSMSKPLEDEEQTPPSGAQPPPSESEDEHRQRHTETTSPPTSRTWHPSFLTLLALFVAFRLLTLLLLRPGGFIRDWSDFDTFLGQSPGDGQRPGHHDIGRNDGDVSPLAFDVGPANGKGVLSFRDQTFTFIKQLVFHEADRVGIANGTQEQALGVIRCAGIDDLDARDVDQEALQRLGVLGRRARS